MQIAQDNELTICSVTADELDGEPWTRADTPVDVVRLVDPENVDDALLTGLGFLRRPHWVNWCAAVRGTEQEFVSLLSGKTRRDIATSRRFVEGEGLRLDARPGLTPELLDEFLVLYDQQIAAMPRGVDFARRQRASLLAAAEDYVGFYLYDGPTLVAASLWWMRRDLSVLQGRYTAVSPGIRAGGVTRYFYLQALEFARRNGMRFASLGNDPSLYGHLVQPGLYEFKIRFGFAPIPSSVFDARFQGQYVDRFLSLRVLSAPSLVVTWEGWLEDPVGGLATVDIPRHDLVVLCAEADDDHANLRKHDACRRIRHVTLPAVPAGATA